MNMDSYIDTAAHSPIKPCAFWIILEIPSEFARVVCFSVTVWGVASHLPIRLRMMNTVMLTVAWTQPDGVRREPMRTPIAANAHGVKPFTDETRDRAKGYAPDMNEPAENTAPAAV